jgi:hypothetical protein
VEEAGVDPLELVGLGWEGWREPGNVEPAAEEEPPECASPPPLRADSGRLSVPVIDVSDDWSCRD